MPISGIADRLHAIRDRIHAAAERCRRAPDSVALLAVSKTFPVEAVLEATEAGQVLFGENRVQEALSKIPLSPKHLRWHLIGPLQSNKVRKILPQVETIQSLDSLDLARQISRISGELSLTANLFIEVNVGAENSKHGFDQQVLREQFADLLSLPNLNISGLMCVPPFEEDVEKTRPYFAQLRELRDDLQASFNHPLPTLSMGMSHDFEIAIEEGSTLVRVGSAIFGGR